MSICGPCIAYGKKRLCEFNDRFSVYLILARGRMNREAVKRGDGYDFSEVDLFLDFDNHLGNLLLRKLLLQKEIDEYIVNKSK